MHGEWNVKQTIMKNEVVLDSKGWILVLYCVMPFLVCANSQPVMLLKFCIVSREHSDS